MVAATGISPGLAHHFVTATVYALGPVTLFWMAWRLGGNRAAALAAGIGYSLISPACLLVKEVRFDAGGWFAGRRLDTLIVYGEGPHLTALCLLPLAIALLHLALTKRRPWYYLLAALGIAAVPLSNWLGAMALAFSIAAYLLSGFHTRWLPAWLRTAALGIAAYALALPWMSPAVIAVIRANAPRVAHNFESDTLQRIYLAAAAAAFLLLAWALARFQLAPATRFSLLISLLFGITALGRYWFNLSLVPQPERYHLEMDMAFWLAVAFLAWPWVARIPRRGALALGAAAAIACVPVDRTPAPRGARLGQAHRYPHHHRIQDRPLAGHPHARTARLRARHHQLLAQRLQRHAGTRRRLRQRHRQSLPAPRHLPDLRGRQAAESPSTC